MALLCDPRIDSLQIRPRVDAGRVTLEGRVPTLAMRRDAQQVTGQLPGVMHVDNQLLVDPGNVRDSVIKAQVERALDQVVLVPDRNLRVDVYEGTVRLTGTLESFAQSADVEAVARTIQGVRAVHNEINVIDPVKLRRNATRTDTPYNSGRVDGEVL